MILAMGFVMGGMDTVWGGVSAEPVTSPINGINRFMARRLKRSSRVRQAQMKSVVPTPSVRVVETPNDFVTGTGSGAGVRYRVFHLLERDALFSILIVS
jgi:hypothetical protein